MYELKKIGKVFTSKFVGTGPLFYKKRIYRAAVSQRLRNTGLDTFQNGNSNYVTHTPPTSLNSSLLTVILPAVQFERPRD